MFELLFYLNIECANTKDLINRIQANPNINDSNKTELVSTVKEATPHCNWDAND